MEDTHYLDCLVSAGVTKGSQSDTGRQLLYDESKISGSEAMCISLESPE